MVRSISSRKSGMSKVLWFCLVTAFAGSLVDGADRRTPQIGSERRDHRARAMQHACAMNGVVRSGTSAPWIWGSCRGLAGAGGSFRKERPGVPLALETYRTLRDKAVERCSEFVHIEPVHLADIANAQTRLCADKSDHELRIDRHCIICALMRNWYSGRG